MTRARNGSHARVRALAFASAVALTLLTSAAFAEQVSREQDIGDLRLGQHITVDDGSCPQGQIKEIYGAKLTAAGVVRIKRCIPRLKK